MTLHYATSKIPTDDAAKILAGIFTRTPICVDVHEEYFVACFRDSTLGAFSL